MIQINCDLCGRVDERLFRALIEGVELDVCSACSKFGKILATIHRPSPKEQHKEFQKRMQAQEKEEKIELLVDGYADIIKKKRDSMGISQKDFASKINEKESTIHKIESGAFEPQLSLAKKLERELGIKIIEDYQERHEKPKKSRINSFTIGDIINKTLKK